VHTVGTYSAFVGSKLSVSDMQLRRYVVLVFSFPEVSDVIVVVQVLLEDSTSLKNNSYGGRERKLRLISHRLGRYSSPTVVHVCKDGFWRLLLGQRSASV
jgi:hypothetical protein